MGRYRLTSQPGSAIGAGLALALALACSTPPPTPEPAAQPGPAAVAGSAKPQEPPPATEIFIADLIHGGARPEIGRPTNATRRAGYDNQPAFLADGSGLLYTAIVAADPAEIFRFDIARGRSERLTATPEAEYSPLLLEGGFSVVRVELDGRQRLWRYATSGEPLEPLLDESVEPVGYHVWCDAATLALFRLGEPATLVVASLDPGAAPRTFAHGIGRSLHRIPGTHEISFVSKPAAGAWWLTQLDPATGQVERLIETPAGSEDHAWTPWGSVLMAQGSRVLVWTPGTDAGWIEVSDLAEAGLETITRLAVSPAGDRLALVAAEVAGDRR